MPEAPELEVIKDILRDRVVGQDVLSAAETRPGVVRALTADLSDLAGRRLEEVERRGKFLTLHFSGQRLLVINPMLAGGLQHCPPSRRRFKRTFFVLLFEDGKELRYVDQKQMGRVYYVTPEQLSEVPQLDDMGPDVLAPLTFEEFQRRIAPFRGEIKGVLTRGRVVSGIGNAYADEILFAAGIYPFRKRTSMSEDELRRVHEQARAVVEEAVGQVRGRIGDDIHLKPRDFLKVHNRGGEPCPRCGARISELTANRRITSYCRTCQPGMLIGNR